MTADVAQAQAKRIFEPANVEELLRGWVLHAHKGRDRHDEAARRSDRYRYWLGVPAIVLAAVVGTSVFASMQTNVEAAPRIVIGLISFTASALASLQTFYNFADRSEKHRLAGARYKAIIRELEQVLAEPIEQVQGKGDYLADLRKRLDDLELEAPVVPEGIYLRIERRYAQVRFTEQAGELVP